MVDVGHPGDQASPSEEVNGKEVVHPPVGDDNTGVRPLRRSGRIRRQPSYLQDYEMK